MNSLYSVFKLNARTIPNEDLTSFLEDYDDLVSKLILCK